jgi:hypothetical protein
MGVSDGVYAWREKGIDAGAYSQKLMEYARLAVTMGTTDVLRGKLVLFVEGFWVTWAGSDFWHHQRAGGVGLGAPL